MLSLRTCKSQAVIGAGGKMGSGISLLLLEHLAKHTPKATLNLIDQSEESLIRLKKYLKDQLKKIAERSIIELRELYKDRMDLVDNHEIVQHHIESAFETVFFSTSLEDTKNKDLIFEAVFENIDLKIDILKKIATFSEKGLVLSNTSSIPIHYLEKESELLGRIAGFHFYNPPAVQKLVEVVVPENSSPELLSNCLKIGNELGKTCVLSRDVAGFIGNGIFMREILFTLRMLEKMTVPKVEAILTLDIVTKTFLIRPMGIFQLIDYVGIDVAVNVLGIMSRFLKDPSIDSELLKRMLLLGKKGGHQGDSGQMEGFFRYKEGQPDLVYDPESNQYIPINAIEEKCLRLIDYPLENVPSWKGLSKEKEPEKTIRNFYINFVTNPSFGAQLALKYLNFEKDISFLLVKTGTAQNAQDISKVLKLGFYHLFGPDSQFLQEISFCQRCSQ